jgi:hypothetical protein
MPKPIKSSNRALEHWEAFEQTVASVQRLFSPDADVRHNQKIADLKNRRRQFDVVIRGEWAGQKVLGVIECKYTSRPVNLPHIEAFITKSRSVNANIALVVSRAGFTEEAISLARDNGIGTLSLLPDERSNPPFRIGYQSYARIFEWTTFTVEIFFEGATGLGDPLDAESIEYDGKKVLDWFRKQLATEHNNKEELGWFSCVVQFDSPKPMNVNGSARGVRAVRFAALREMRVKTKFQTLSGQAFYDWQDKTWRLPPGGFLLSGEIDSRFSDWCDFHGEIPENPEGGFSINMDIFRRRFDPTADVVDLESI